MSEQADLTVPDTFLDVSASYGRLACLQDRLPLILKTNPHTYLSPPDPADPFDTTWLGLAFEGMGALRRWSEPPVREVAVIGTGSGLDVVGISNLFAPERIVASDIHPRALEAARWNIRRYARPGTRCEVLRSDLFRQYPERSAFDLIYENLPNVPDGGDLFEGIQAASCYEPARYRSDPVAGRLLLTLHYNFLVEARAHLRPGGWVVCMIGGRIPWAGIEEVFTRAGYRASVLHFGLKTQSEAGLVLEGYARAESNGSPSFLYYHPAETCRALLARHRAGPHGAAAGAGPVEPSFLNAALEGCRVSAMEALLLHRRGERVCHSVYTVGATLAAGPGPQE